MGDSLAAAGPDEAVPGYGQRLAEIFRWLAIRAAGDPREGAVQSTGAPPAFLTG